MFSKANLSFQALPHPGGPDYTDEQMQSAATAFLERMKTRHSTRYLADTPVPRQVIETCIRAAGRAPSGANHQPWHFVAIQDPSLKAQIRQAAEAEEAAFYAGGGGDEWIKALEPLGTGVEKPHLTTAPWLIVVFAQRWGTFDDGSRYKNYYVPESVGIATGFLITALHHAGLASLTHTPTPMKFLNKMLYRPKSEKATMILVVGHPAENATIPKASTLKNPLPEILTFR